MKQEGMFWHVHHDELVEYCYNYDKRVEFIKERKPGDEIEARLRLFKPVEGELPEELVRAGEAVGKAEKDVVAADHACGIAEAGTYEAAIGALHEANAAHSKAWVVWRQVAQNNISAIKELHAKECPDCIWDDDFQELIFY